MKSFGNPAKQREWPKSAQETFGLPKIHATVLERVKHVKEYDPWILKDFPEYEVDPWNEMFEYEGDELSIRDYSKDSWRDKFEFDGERIKIKMPENYYDRLLKRGEWGNGRLKRDLTRWWANLENK